jgi:hypothetical protein
VREAPVYFSDEALSEYRRDLGLDEVAESFMHFRGGCVRSWGRYSSTTTTATRTHRSILARGGQLEPLVEALHPDPESAEWDKMRKHLESIPTWPRP